jgi:nucleotide-binding universal stress UspA family protein
MFNHILVPTDGSPLSASTVDQVLEFAREAAAKVTVLMVSKPFRISLARSQAVQHLAEAERRAKALGVPCDIVQTRHIHPFRAITKTAKNSGCDLIAMALHGWRETSKVLTHSSIPVLIYRR